MKLCVLVFLKWKVILIALCTVAGYFLFTRYTTGNNKHSLPQQEKTQRKFVELFSPIESASAVHVLTIFTKVENNRKLESGFNLTVNSLLKYNSGSLLLHVITDAFSAKIATEILSSILQKATVVSVSNIYIGIYTQFLF